MNSLAEWDVMAEWYIPTVILFSRKNKKRLPWTAALHVMKMNFDRVTIKGQKGISKCETWRGTTVLFETVNLWDWRGWFWSYHFNVSGVVLALGKAQAIKHFSWENTKGNKYNIKYWWRPNDIHATFYNLKVWYLKKVMIQIVSISVNLMNLCLQFSFYLKHFIFKCLCLC